MQTGKLELVALHPFVTEESELLPSSCDSILFTFDPHNLWHLCSLLLSCHTGEQSHAHVKTHIQASHSFTLPKECVLMCSVWLSAHISAAS